MLAVPEADWRVKIEKRSALVSFFSFLDSKTFLKTYLLSYFSCITVSLTRVLMKIPSRACGIRELVVVVEWTKL